MNLIPSHSVEVTPTPTNCHGLYLSFGGRGDDERNCEIIRDKPHPYNLLQETLRLHDLKVPGDPMICEDLILYNRPREGAGESLRLNNVSTLAVGRLADMIGLGEVIPTSGPIDVPLLGSLICREKGLWIDGALAKDPRRYAHLGSGIGGARALVTNQNIIPDDFHLNRTQLLFPGTIVFDPDIGICIPEVVKLEGTWIIRHRDLLSQVIPGVDLFIWWW